jgi:hypothetical protein
MARKQYDRIEATFAAQAIEAMPYNTTKDECDAAIRAAQTAYGVKWKERLLRAWMTGDYGSLRGTDHTCILQRMRNSSSKALHSYYDTPFARRSV